MNDTPLQIDDPLAQPRRLTKRWTITAAAALPLLIWAVWPARPPALPPASPSLVAAEAKPSRRQPIRLAAFDAPIWTLEPPPPVPVAPPPPLRLQLVGLIRDGEAGGPLKAVIYDPDADELIVVSEGTRIGPRTVTRIDATGVTLADASGAGPRRLLMEETP